MSRDEREKAVTYGDTVLALAELFLDDEPKLNTPENADELARDIQKAIRDFFAAKDDKLRLSRDGTVKS